MKEYSLKVKRYDPDKKEGSEQESFVVKGGKGEKITYGLNEIQKKCDPSMSYLIGCKTGHCGLCSMMINGKPGLACMENLGPESELEALKGLPVVKDLVTDRETVFRSIGERIRKITNLCGFRPFALDGKIQAAPETFLDKTNCVLCLCCLAVCPARKKSEHALYLPLEFLLLDMMNFADMKDRDKGREALELTGLMECTDCKKCQEACPRDIKIYDRIIKPMKDHFSS